MNQQSPSQKYMLGKLFKRSQKISHAFQCHLWYHLQQQKVENNVSVQQYSNLLANSEYYIFIKNHNYKHYVETWKIVLSEKSKTQNSITLSAITWNQIGREYTHVRLVFLLYIGVVKIQTFL